MSRVATGPQAESVLELALPLTVDPIRVRDPFLEFLGLVGPGQAITR